MPFSTFQRRTKASDCGGGQSREREENNSTEQQGRPSQEDNKREGRGLRGQRIRAHKNVLVNSNTHQHKQQQIPPGLLTPERVHMNKPTLGVEPLAHGALFPKRNRDVPKKSKGLNMIFDAPRSDVGRDMPLVRACELCSQHVMLGCISSCVRTDAADRGQEGKGTHPFTYPPSTTDAAHPPPKEAGRSTLFSLDRVYTTKSQYRAPF